MNKAVARLKARVLGLILALMCGGGLFVMTAWLVVKGGPQVGKHLQLLGNYFIGYSVSWTGAFVGLAYGAVVGWVAGWAIGTVYNRIVGLRRGASA